MATSTSFRISDTAKRRLSARSARERISATALLDRLIIEGIDQLDYSGIVFRGPAHDRRAALAAGPMCGRSSRGCASSTAQRSSASPS